MDNLDRCMILCEKEGFGVHYGAWRATKGIEPVFEVEVKIPEGWKACLYCGKIFKPAKRSDQKFCDAVCQSKASNKRFKRKKKETA